MDCTVAAANLQNLLVAQGNAETQVAALELYRMWMWKRRQWLQNDDQINGVAQQSLVSALDGNKSQDLHLSLRRSVCEGVKVMYNKYQDKKWSQVQETARSIIQNLEGEQTSLPVTSSSPGGSTSIDKAADKWSMAFCEFYRDN